MTNHCDPRQGVRRRALGILAVLLLATGIRAARAQELLGNGDFEAGVEAWSGCGGASVVDAHDATTLPTMVRSGRFGGRIGGPSDGSCGPLPASQMLLVQQVAIPADATDLTLSFWYSRLGPELVPEGNTFADLRVSLTTDPYLSSSLFDVVSHNAIRGWMPFRGVLPRDEVARFRGQTAYLRFAIEYTADYDLAYFLDDLSLVTADVRTQAQPVPAALAGDGSRPLVLLQRHAANPDGLTVVRLDTDGTNPLAIDTGLHRLPRLPRWSPDGAAIAVADDDVFPRDASVDATLKARITRLSLVGPDGSARREVFATQGLPGSHGSQCTPPPCVDPEGPALDQVIRGVEWSADARVLLVTVCARNRLPSGYTGDESCGVHLVDALTGQVLRSDLDGWFRPDVGPTGLILFNGPTRYPDFETRGVWEADPSGARAQQTLILAAPLDLLVGGDRLPTWAPDGRHFVTVREMGGYRYGADGFAVRNEVVMLHDREFLGNPRALLLADHGGVSRAIDDVAWSPDGRWLLYALYESADMVNVWWLDVTTGATGRVTTDGASVSVDWRARGADGPGSGPTGACAAELPGVARAACYLVALQDGIAPTTPLTPAGRRLRKRLARNAAAARRQIAQLAKSAPPSAKRLAKARKAIRRLATSIERAETHGLLAGDTADTLATLLAAAIHELEAA